MRIHLLCLAAVAWIGLPAPVSAQLPWSKFFSDPAATPAAEPPLVGFERLITFLPDPPEGWDAESPNGTTTNSDVLKLTTVRRIYYKGEHEYSPKAIVTIIDSANNRDYFDSAPADWKSSVETPEGYDRRVEVEGMRAFEHYSKAANTSSLSVFVGKRYFVQIELTNDDPDQLRKWFKRIDIKRLAALK